MEEKKKIAREIIEGYQGPPVRIMEVCGTHTHEIFRLGIRKLLPPQVELISGPGCPVCVTPVGFIDEAVYLALEKKATICTFGDLVRVPGTKKSLADARAEGAKIRINLIGRLYDVTSGEVLVGGRNVKEYDLEKLRDEVSVVLQSNVLFSGTILDNLRWGNENATEEECVNACKLACADDFIQTFPEKYNTFIERGGTNVSGGQKQRICIARALLKKPKILILDDSTSAVDTATDAKIRKAFAEEIPNTTKLIISQRISSVQNADKIIVLDNGKISGVGSHDELLNKNDIYTEIYEAQTKGSGDFDAKGEM